MNLKYQVFVSSTHNDLIEERQAVIEELLGLDCIPAAMEFFQPIDKSLDIIKRVLDNCDYVVLIVAGRYGSLIKRRTNRISFTEEEYRYAKKNKIPVIVLLLDEKILDKLRKSKKPADLEKIEKTVVGQRRLSRFRKELKDNQQVSFYKTKKDIRKYVASAVKAAINEKPRPGWIRVERSSGWSSIFSASEKNYRSQTQYKDIKSLFHNGKGVSAKLRLAFPLTRLLIGKSKREAKRLLQQPGKTIIKKAISSEIYKRNSDTKTIEFNQEWISLVYAMCYVSENHLHLQSSRGFGENPSLSNLTWWKSPWDDVILYISQICSDEGFINMTNRLLRDVNKHNNEKIRFECLELIVRAIMSRSSVQIDLLNRVSRAFSSISSRINNTE
jgi:hypothetical protein